MQKSTLDLSFKNIPPLFYAMQGDTDRKVQVALFDGGVLYDASSDAVSVWYSGPGGDGNFSEGISIEKNVLTITLNGNITAVPGNYALAVMLSRSNGKVSTWNMILKVGVVPGYGSPAAQDYFEAFQAGELAQRLESVNVRITSEVATLNGSIANESASLANRIDAVDSRISGIVADGQQTDGNTELLDIRVGYDGTRYTTAGDAVRKQTKSLNEAIQSVVSMEYKDYNRLDPKLVKKGTLGSNGNFTENPSSPYVTSDFIEIKNGETYNLSYFHQTYKSRYNLIPSRLCVYNENKIFIESATSFSPNETSSFSSYRENINRNGSTLVFIPKINGFIRIQYGADIQEAQIRTGIDPTYLDVFEQIILYSMAPKVVNKSNLSEDLQGKIYAPEKVIYPWQTLYYCRLHTNVLFIGDSLTEGYAEQGNSSKYMSYPSVCGKFCGWNVENKGIAGITSLGWWKSYGKAMDFSKYDAAFIYLGTNGGLTDTISEDTQSGDYNTFSETNTGGYCAIVSKALSQNPTIKIYVIVYDTNPETQSITASVTMKIAEKYDCTIFNVTDKTYFDLGDKKYHTDLTHYNAVGYFCFALNILSQLENYIENNVDKYFNVGYNTFH